jgi:hypothetical protein
MSCPNQAIIPQSPEPTMETVKTGNVFSFWKFHLTLVGFAGGGRCKQRSVLWENLSWTDKPYWLLLLSWIMPKKVSFLPLKRREYPFSGSSFQTRVIFWEVPFRVKTGNSINKVIIKNPGSPLDTINMGGQERMGKAITGEKDENTCHWRSWIHWLPHGFIT